MEGWEKGNSIQFEFSHHGLNSLCSCREEQRGLYVSLPIYIFACFQPLQWFQLAISGMFSNKQEFLLKNEKGNFKSNGCPHRSLPTVRRQPCSSRWLQAPLQLCICGSATVPMHNCTHAQPSACRCDPLEFGEMRLHGQQHIPCSQTKAVHAYSKVGACHCVPMHS